MATKKFSPAQIAAQKLFAERARAGTLGKGKRKANPAKKYRFNVTSKTSPRYVAGFFSTKEAAEDYRSSLNSPFNFTITKKEIDPDVVVRKTKATIERDIYGVPSVKRKPNPGLYDNINAKRARIAAGSGERMRKPGSKGAPTQEAFEQSAMTAKRKRNPSTNRGLAIYLDAIAAGETYSESKLMEALDHPALSTSDKAVIRAAIRGASYSHTALQDIAIKIRNYVDGRKTNPDKEKPNVYIKRVSQATGASPTKRLVKRRTKALFAPAGYFPNPYAMGKSKKKANFPYCVETKATENFSIQACFKTLAPAKEYANALSKKYPKLTIRVMQYTGGAM